MTIVIFMLVLAGGAGGVWYVMRNARAGNPMAVTARLGRYGVAGLSQSSQAVSEIIAPPGKQRSEQSNISRAVDRMVEGRGFGRKLAVRLERADLKWTPGEYVVMSLAMVMVLLLVGLLVYGSIGMLIGAAVGVAGPWIYVGKRISKRRAKFLEQLADMAQMMGNSMRAGFSIIQSMELVAGEGPRPARDEFERVTAEVKLGLPLDQALEHLEKRMPSEDLGLLVVAINVQRQVGGNLAEILMVISKTVRERVRFTRDLRALTAQARYSSYIITGLPVGVGIVINILDTKYESWLYTASLGHVLIGAAVCMLATGFFFLNRIANIEV